MNLVPRVARFKVMWIKDNVHDEICALLKMTTISSWL